MSSEQSQRDTKSAGTSRAGGADRLGELEKTLEERLAFERLLADLSCRFVNLSGDAVDEEINGALERIVHFLGVDRSGIEQFNPDGKSLFWTHSFTLPGVPPYPPIDLAGHFPWYTAQIRSGRILAYERLPDETPAEAQAELQYVMAHGMKSHLAVPLQAGGKILGGLGVSSFQAYREWPPELVSRLQLLATIFTSAPARKWGEERIKAEWAVTFNSIRDLVSFHDKEFRITRVNKAFAEALGMEEEKLIGQKCYEIIHGTGEPLLPCPHKQTLDDGKPVTEEFWEPRLGMYLQVSVSPILNDRKEVVGSVHIAKDITQRKQAEEALHKAHDDLEKRVEERTGELRRANVQLAQEIEDRKRAEGDLQKAYSEIEQLKEKLVASLSKSSM